MVKGWGGPVRQARTPAGGSRRIFVGARAAARHGMWLGGWRMGEALGEYISGSAQ
jgi:hypothetical protein